MNRALRDQLASAFEHDGQHDENFVDSLLNYLKLRLSGSVFETSEPYSDYATDIVRRLSELNLDSGTMLSGIIWRALKTKPDAEVEMRALFGTEVAELAARIARISGLDFQSTAAEQAEKVRHLILALAKDLRVIFILLADRAHVLGRIHEYPTSNVLKDAMDCRDIYASLANRLGIGRLKFELEDLSFKLIEPDIYRELERKVRARSADQAAYLEMVQKIVEKRLSEEGLAAEVKGRLKHLDSIYKKMLKQKIPFDEVYDIVGLRVITQNVKECYAVLGIIHSLWKPVPKRFKDYIALPKRNMYQSIHTSVIGPSAFPLEVQIRTREMNRIAEIGIAAHWQYKEQDIDRRDHDKFTWLRQMMDLQSSTVDPGELMELFKIDLFPDEVYVFTPRGEVKCLPKGSTIVDFAFLIHTDVGFHCKGGRVNNQLVPLKTQLRTGDIVEVLTSARAIPRSGWLDFVVTSSARSKIRRYLREQSKDAAIQAGREILQRHFRKKHLSVQKLYDSEDVVRAVNRLGYQTLDELYAAVGFGEFCAQTMIERLSGIFSGNQLKLKKKAVHTAAKAPRVSVDGNTEMIVHFARCCEPLPGESIVGFITQGRGVSIHASRCTNLRKLSESRKVAARWDADDRPGYPVRIVFQGHDQPDLLARITRVFAESGASILSQRMETTGKKRVKGEFRIEITNLKKLETILEELSKVPGITVASRSLAR